MDSTSHHHYHSSTYLHTKSRLPFFFDMYPLYWTLSKEGVFMRYSYEYKRKCVQLHRQGKWAKSPDGISTRNFHNMIRKWARIEDANGALALQHPAHNKAWSAEEKLELVSRVLAGESNKSVACKAGISDGMLYNWVRRYKTEGYNGLVGKKKVRKQKDQSMKKNMNIDRPRPLVESEREELIRLRAENASIKAENEVIKKEIALREEKEAARLKAKKQRSSKNSGKKDIS